MKYFKYYYKILGLELGASESRIRDAHTRIMHNGSNLEKKLAQEAYEILMGELSGPIYEWGYLLAERLKKIF
jgi:hypothetical protein